MKNKNYCQKIAIALCFALALLLTVAVAGICLPLTAQAENAVVGTAESITIGYDDVSGKNSELFYPLNPGLTEVPGTFDPDIEAYHTLGYSGSGKPMENQSDCIVFGGGTKDWKDFVLTFDMNAYLKGGYTVFRIWFRVWDNRDWLGDYVDFSITDDQTVETISFGTLYRGPDDAVGTKTVLSSVSSAQGFIHNKGRRQTVRLAVKGACASLYIDGANVLNTDSLDTTHVGHFEFEFWDAGATICFPMSISTDVSASDLTYDVLANDTAIANPAPIYTYINSVKTWNSIQLNSPSAAIAYFNDEGNLVTREGTHIGTRNFTGVYETLKSYGIVTCFYLSDSTQGELLANALAKMDRDYVMVFSNDSIVLRRIKTLFPDVICAYDASGDQASLSAVRTAVNTGGARVALLSQSQATKSFVDGLQAMGISVIAEADVANDITDIYTVILSGANGVVGEVSAIMNIYTAFSTATLVRSPDLIAYRGACDTPNTVEGATAAVKSGYNAVEADIFLTKDGKIVVSGSYLLGTFAEGNGNIEDMTEAEVTAKHVYSSDGTLSEHTVPALENYLAAIKNENAVLYLQINPSSYTTYENEASYLSALKTALKPLIEEYGMQDRIVFLTFYQSIAANFSADDDFSAYTVGLTFSAAAHVLANGDYSAVSGSINRYNATMFVDYGSLSGQVNLLYQMARRGVLVNAWDYNSETVDALCGDYLAGYDALVTDNASALSGALKDVSSDRSEYYLNDGAAEIVLSATDYKGTALSPEGVGYLVIEGNVTLEKTENGYRATALGGEDDAYVVFYGEDSLNGKTYRVYTQPVKIGLNDNEPGGDAANGTDGTDGDHHKGGLSGGAIAGIVIGCVAAVAIVATVTVILIKRKSTRGGNQ